MAANFSGDDVTGFLEHEGFRLRYRIEGQGPPLLIVGSSIYHPRTFSPALRRHRRLIFADHRGFAPCDRRVVPEDAALERVIGDIERLRQHLGIERLDVAGHSANAYLAMEYARRFPRHAGRVVAVAIGPSYAPAYMDLLETLWNETVAPERKRIFEEQMAKLPEDLAGHPDQGFIALCIRMGARSWFDPAHDGALLWQDVHVNMPIIDRLWGETFRDLDMHALLKEIASPILLVLGRFDYIVAPAWTWDAYRADAVDLTLRHFENSAHAPQSEESEAFDRVLLGFLQQ